MRLSLLAAALVLCGVAVINGGPIYYPDTGAYLIDADRFLQMQLPFGVRPIFYGLAIWPLHWGTWFFPALFAQALIVAHIVHLVARVCGCGLRPRGTFLLIAGLAVLTPVSFHVSHLLPDIFVGVLILTLFLLGFCADRLSRFETGYLILLATASASFHLTALPVGLVLFLLAMLVAVSVRWQTVTPWRVFAPIMLAVVLSFGFSVVVFQRLSLTPRNPPHLLARILADGPGREFLRVTCPATNFMLCAYQDRLTSIEDDFLWRLLPSIPAADGYRIKAEAGAVIWGTIEMYPADVIGHMVGNTLRQLVTFGSETQVSSQEWDEFQSEGTPLARSLKNSWQAAGRFEKPALQGINTFLKAAAAASLVISLVTAWMGFRLRLYRPVALVITVLTGLTANAAACGALGGVFARYQGRVIWLLPLSAIIGVLTLMRAGVVRSNDQA